MAWADINAIKGDGYSLLTGTIHPGHSLFTYTVFSKAHAVQKVLIAAGANVNNSGRDGRTPLHEAARNLDIESVRNLIAAKANVNAIDMHDNKTPLQALQRQYGFGGIWDGRFGKGPERDNAYKTYKDIFLMLIDAGASVNTTEHHPTYGTVPIIDEILMPHNSGALIDAPLIDGFIETLISKGAVLGRSTLKILMHKLYMWAQFKGKANRDDGLLEGASRILALVPMENLHAIAKDTTTQQWRVCNRDGNFENGLLIFTKYKQSSRQHEQSPVSSKQLEDANWDNERQELRVCNLRNG